MPKGTIDGTKKATLVYKGHVSPPHIDAAAFMKASEMYEQTDKIFAALEELVLAGGGFYVEGMKGPLAKGELDRAEEWAQKLFA